MSDNFSFECLLLSRMKEPYRATVLRANRLTEDEAAALASTSAVGFPEVLRGSLESYRRSLGETVARSTETSGPLSHAFPLKLWSSMCWLVHVDAKGRTTGIEFAPRVEQLLPVSPVAMNPGEWTLGEIRRMANEIELVDGWDEHAVMRVVIDGNAFDGEFVFGLLQSWKRCAD